MAAPVLTNWIKPKSQFPPQMNRYHLYVSLACPFATRCLAVYHIKGLQDVIGLSVTHPVYQFTKPGNKEDKHRGWVFRSPEDPPVSNTDGHGQFSCEGCIPDAVNGFATLRDVYELSGITKGPYSVPVLFDTETKTIVNNDSSDVAEMLATQFNAWAKQNTSLDLVPESKREAMAGVDKWILPEINNRVYAVGLAKTQDDYDKHISVLFSALDKAERILSTQRFLCGNQLTLSDIKLFTSLVRYNLYFILFKCSKKALSEYPNLLNYARDIYQFSTIADSVNLTHVANSYYGSFIDLSPLAIVPVIPDNKLSEPHGREKL